MTSVAVLSASGSPGVTVASLLLGLGWGGPVTVVELSSSGGTAAGVCGLRWRPGVADLAAAAAPQGQLTAAGLSAHCQWTRSGVPVVVGAPDPVRASGASRTLAPLLASYLQEGEGSLILDCGRVGPQGGSGSELLSVVCAADVVLVVVRDGEPGETAARLSHAQATAQGLAAQAAGRVGVVVVGVGDGRQVASRMPVPSVAAIPLRSEVVAAVSDGVAGKDRAGIANLAHRLAEATRQLTTSLPDGLEPVPDAGLERSVRGVVRR